MAPVPLARLVILQNNRIEEIDQIGTRMQERNSDTLNKIIVQSRVETVKELWAEVRRTHNDIAMRADSVVDPYIIENRFQSMRRVYEDTLDWLLTTLANFSSDQRSNPPRRERTEDDDISDRPAKLPRLDLPSFSGKYEDWDSFADIFCTLVHKAPRLADTTKLQYLKSCLKGPAAELVKDVAILGVNYASTWEALKNRFFNPRLTVNKLLDSLANLPYMRKESAIELRAFVDETRRIVRALTNMKAPVAHWDMWLLHTLEVRLDPESRKTWESELIARNWEKAALSPDKERDIATHFAKFEDLAVFLERRAQSLSVIHSDRDDKRAPQNPSLSSRKIHHARYSPAVAGSKCPLCTGDHILSRCPNFVGKTAYDREKDVRRLKLCFNCLVRHRSKNCSSTYRCKVCKEKHHSLLHFKRAENRNVVVNKEAASSKAEEAPASQVRAHVAQSAGGCDLLVNACNTSASKSERSVLLATAQVTIFNSHGKRTRARALLDQGSEATFVSESLVQLLGLSRDRIQTKLTGIGGCKAGVVKHATCFTLQSHADSKFQIDINAFVLPQLTSELPARNLVELDISHFQGLALADPEFYRSGRVDIILGADVYGQFLRTGLKTFSSTLIVAQNTALGWIVSGPTERGVSRRTVFCNQASNKVLRCVVNDDLSELFQRFWKVEEISNTVRKLKPADESCERFFKDTHTRDTDGRFKVHLPLKAEPPSVAMETRRMALGSLKHQQRRFSGDDYLAREYVNFMETYKKLAHMIPVRREELNNPRAWYLPHHAVITGTPPTSKIRVVFDASRKTRDNYCLNDFLMSGPPLQGDLALILLNWRQYRYVFVADIVKMFRQIRVAREDQDLQRIVWSPSPESPITDFCLTTVTYGTACAPYLAIRTLLQLAHDEKARFPLGAECLQSNAYVDDMFVGANDLATALCKRDELVGILASANIKLDKWAANHPDLLRARTQSRDANASKAIEGNNDVKTLGVHWNPSSDRFNFSSTNFNSNARTLTKRSVYSEIARLFDPLGWLAPVTVVAKIIMQDVWLAKCEWDEPLTTDIREKWQLYRESLSSLPILSINRWLGVAQDRSYEIHGFSDASSRAYAAAVYLRINDSNGNFQVSLLTAKTKVAPVKTISIPNLELSGATLLVKLVAHIRKLDFLQNIPIRLWSDSQIVLTWLRKHPCNWKVFVANRVSFIQTELPSAVWGYVPTKENPADLATRGSTPIELQVNELWWHGPAWLAAQSENWPMTPTARQALHTRSCTDEPVLMTKFSSLTRLIRVTAWCLRPLMRLRRRRTGPIPLSGALSSSELDNARVRLVKIAQYHAFPKEIEHIKARKSLPKHNSLVKLKPFIDSNGVLRVGGRLNNANFPRDIQHPPILPRLSTLSRLYVKYAHRYAMHGGPTLTTSVLMRFVWVIGMRSLVKSVVYKCVMCQRHKPRLAHQLMGDLPPARVTPARPFTTTGMDYAGPFQVRTSKGRGQRTYKGYIALSVCFTTKAIHLELVSDLTTATFIAAFRRFVSRRGLCKQIFSDNAATYRGADAELRSMFQAASKFYKDISEVLANEGVSWTFIPPTTPHYGGLWEAGVKSTKNLLKKMIGEHTLTFEELSTVLAEIESCLNSRPLCPLSSDPDDLQVLIPSHFLLGTASGMIPDIETPAVPLNRLDRFQLLQRIRDQFWKRWSSEYVLQLQERGKWRKSTANITVGQLVLLKDDRYPASKWPLGRVREIHPGADGLVRVVTVKTATNTLRRHIACLAPLALEQPEEKKQPRIIKNLGYNCSSAGRRRAVCSRHLRSVWRGLRLSMA